MYNDLDTFAIIDLDAIKHNVREIKRKLENIDIIYVLKADAYGHKATEIFRLLIEEGSDKFAVANLSEALELREIDNDVEIIVLGRISPSSIKIAIKNKISFTIYSEDSWHNLNKVINSSYENIKIHIKINTGFNRLGLYTDEDSIKIIEEIKKCKNVTIESIYSHFALADYKSDVEQFNKFNKFIKQLESKNIKIPKKHIADSITSVDYPWARLDMVRIGALIYGLKADRKSYDKYDLKYSMKLYSTITQIRCIRAGEGVGYDYLFKAKNDMKIATLAFGYADGYPRTIWNKGYVLINGKKAHFTGLMCMDQCMVDITSIDNVKEGDKVLIYEVDSDSEVSLAKISIMANTNKNNIISSLAKRVVRVYKSDGKEYVVNQLLGDE